MVRRNRYKIKLDHRDNYAKEDGSVGCARTHGSARAHTHTHTHTHTHQRDSDYVCSFCVLGEFTNSSRFCCYHAAIIYLIT